jgi:hypothetical protein
MIADRIRTHPRAVRHASSAALVLLGVVALYNWILAPQVGCLHAMQELGAMMERVAAEKERLDGTLETKVRQWQSLQRERTELEEGVFTTDGARAFLQGLLPLVEEVGCTIVLADLVGDNKTTRIEEPNVPIVVEVSHPSLVVSGQPDQVCALLQRLQENRPRVWIDFCQCDFPEGGTGPAECNLVLALYAVENHL